jgi:hypothetical protein
MRYRKLPSKRSVRVAHQGEADELERGYEAPALIRRATGRTGCIVFIRRRAL